MQLLGPYDISFAEHAFFQLVHPQAYCACFSSNDHLKIGGGGRGGEGEVDVLSGIWRCVPLCPILSSSIFLLVGRCGKGLWKYMLFGLVLIISHSQCRFAKREHSYFSEEENHVSYKGWKKTTISCLQ